MRRKRTPIIGIDLDEVIWGLTEAWLQRHNEITGDDVKVEDVKSWDITQYIKKGGRTELFYILEQKDFWQTVKPAAKSAEYLQRLMDDGYLIYIVTASSYRTVSPKLRHFFNLFPFIKQGQVIIAEEKQMIDLDLLVDDNPANLCGGRFNRVLFDAHHNRWCDEEKINAVRIKNWDELYEYITSNFPIGRS